MKFKFKQFTKRRRPHIHPPGAVLFVTFRLAGSVPTWKVREYKDRKKWLDDQLRRARNSEADEINKWLERIENFNRQWFVEF